MNHITAAPQMTEITLEILDRVEEIEYATGMFLVSAMGLRKTSS